MKKISITLAMAFLYLTTFAITKDDIKGVWINYDNQIPCVSYEFTNDSLFIDEIGFEGFTYTYEIKNDTTIVIRDVFGYPEEIKVEPNKKNKHIIKIDGYTYYKKAE